jgi:hypothetical protein
VAYAHVKDTVFTGTGASTGGAYTNTAGSYLVAEIAGYWTGDSPNGISTITDTSGNQWFFSSGTSTASLPPQIGAYYSSGNYYGMAAIAWCYAGANTGGTIAVNWTSSVTDASYCVVSEFSGLPSGCVLIAGETASVLAAETSYSPPAFNPRIAPVVVCAVTATSAAWTSIAGGFTSASLGAGACWDIPTTTGTVTPAYSASSAIEVLIAVVASLGTPQASSMVPQHGRIPTRRHTGIRRQEPWPATIQQPATESGAFNITLPPPLLAAPSNFVGLLALSSMTPGFTGVVWSQPVVTRGGIASVPPPAPVLPQVLTHAVSASTESGPFNIALSVPLVSGLSGAVWSEPVLLTEPARPGPPPPPIPPQILSYMRLETGSFNITLPDVVLSLTGAVWSEPVLLTEPPKAGPPPPPLAPQVLVRLQGSVESGSFNITLPVPSVGLFGTVWSEPVLTVVPLRLGPSPLPVPPQVLPQLEVVHTESGSFNITLLAPLVSGLTGEVWSEPVLLAEPAKPGPPPPPVPAQVLVQLQGSTESGAFNIVLPSPSVAALSGTVWSEPVLLAEPPKAGPPPPPLPAQVFVQLQGHTESGAFNLTLQAPAPSLNATVWSEPVLVVATAKPGPPPPPLQPQVLTYVTPAGTESGPFSITLLVLAVQSLAGTVWSQPVLLTEPPKAGPPPPTPSSQVLVQLQGRTESGGFNVTLPALSVGLAGTVWSEPVLIVARLQAPPPPPPLQPQVVTEYIAPGAESGPFEIALPVPSMQLSATVWSEPILVIGVAPSGPLPSPVRPQVLSFMGLVSGSFNITLPILAVGLSGTVWSEPILLTEPAKPGSPPPPISSQVITRLSTIESGSFNITLPTVSVAGLVGTVWSQPVVVTALLRPGPPPVISPQVVTALHVLTGEYGPFNTTLALPVLSLVGEVTGSPLEGAPWTARLGAPEWMASVITMWRAEVMDIEWRAELVTTSVSAYQTSSQNIAMNVWGPLGVVLSSLSDPKVAFLDVPPPDMDPENGAEPTSGQWVTGSWGTNSIEPPYQALGSMAGLAAGTWYVWVQVDSTGTGEIPVLFAGVLYVN